jgi:D-alanyl-D-alanine endopeptidase (penicillin-binding protein 7)
MLNQKPSVLVYNATDDKILLKTNMDVQRPIASITKLMTAMVFLDTNPDLSEEIPLPMVLRDQQPEGEYSRAEYFLEAGMYTKRDLLTAMLVTSDNNAAIGLMRSCGGKELFVPLMNKKAAELGATNTVYYEPHGSVANNLSTAEDLHKIVVAASNYPAICQYSTLKQTTVKTTFMENINSYMLYLFNEVEPVRLIKLCKTGLTEDSGYSVATGVEKNNKFYTVTILGMPSYTERDEMLKKLINNMLR